MCTATLHSETTSHPHTNDQIHLLSSMKSSKADNFIDTFIQVFPSAGLKRAHSIRNHTRVTTTAAALSLVVIANVLLAIIYSTSYRAIAFYEQDQFIHHQMILDDQQILLVYNQEPHQPRKLQHGQPIFDLIATMAPLGSDPTITSRLAILAIVSMSGQH